MTSTPKTSHTLVTVGYDESATSRAAVMWAAQEAVARAAALRIVTAWDPSPITPWGLPDLPKWRKHASQAAHRAAIVALDIARDHPDAMSVAIEGPASKILADESTRSDLIVVGSAGRLGEAGWLTGSVSRYLSHHSACPVVVVGPHAHLDPMRRLVVSSNLDPDGETDSWIARWLDHRPVEVHVVGSFHLTTTVPDWLTKDVQANVRQSVQARNAEWIERLRRQVDGQAVITHEVVEGTPSAALQQVTRAGDVIVVPASGEHAIPVTHRSCPVAVMPVAAPMRSELEVMTLTAAGTR
jgi:nucleotide-binding universal stress UspA family protein